MTARERAEKIVSTVNTFGCIHNYDGLHWMLLSSRIEEALIKAESEAYQRGMEDAAKMFEKHYQGSCACYASNNCMVRFKDELDAAIEKKEKA